MVRNQLRLFAAIALAIVATAVPAFAQTVIAGYTFHFKILDYNVNSGKFSVPQRFSADRGGTTIDADRASGNATKKIFVATGNVVVHQTHPTDGNFAEFTRKPSTLTCDRLDVNGVSRTYIATGNVHYVQQGVVEQLDRDVVADTATFDDLTNKLHLEGHVTIHEGKSTLVASSVDYDTKSGDFTTPSRFSVTREGTEVQGDKGQGNTHSLQFVALGNVVVNQTQPLQGHGDVTKFTDQPSTLKTDRLDVDGLRKRYTATGNVHFTQVDREATSNNGFLDDISHTLHMDGKVKIRDGDRHLDADTVDYNTETGDVHAAGNVLARAPSSEFAPPPVPKSPAPSKKKK